MKKKILSGREIVIRKLKKEDLQDAEKFQKFFNSFVEEDAKLSIDEKISVKKQKEMLEGSLRKQRKKEGIYLVAKEKENIAGRVYIKIGDQRSKHVATLGGLMIGQNYRRMGIAKHLIKEAILLAKKDLQVSPKLIKISAFGNNEPALRLYKKMGFERVAVIPKQFKYRNKYADEVIFIRYLK